MASDVYDQAYAWTISACFILWSVKIVVVIKQRLGRRSRVMQLAEIYNDIVLFLLVTV